MINWVCYICDGTGKQKDKQGNEVKCPLCDNGIRKIIDENEKT